MTQEHEYADQVPGRTITESELHSALKDYNAALYTEIDTANRLGLIVAPDPEPTTPESVPGRTITQSDYQKLMDDTSVPYGVGFTDGFHQAGGSIIWEPTNAELIIGLMGEAPANLNRRDLAVWLVKAGVRVVTESE